MAQSVAGVGALDQTGDVDDHEGHVANHGHPEIRGESSEGIIRYLRPGSTESREQAGLPGVRFTHEPDVAYGLELQVQPALFARLSLASRARSPVDEPA